MGKKLSLTFRIIRKLGIVHSEKAFGNISPWGVVWLFLSTMLKRIAYGYSYFDLIFNETNKRWLRAWIWRRMGAHIGKNVRIFHRVALDYDNADKIFIEDDVAIANGCTLVCHMRNFKDYYIGGSFKDLPYMHAEIHLKKGCFIGMNAMIMPGVTVGEGAVVGACAFVVRDVPPWTFVAGNPAREIRTLQPRRDSTLADEA